MKNMTFEELQKKGHVSPCGRVLKIWDGLTHYFKMTVDGVVETPFPMFKGENQNIVLKMINFGFVFYSKEYCELARDTMEAEQICRKKTDGISLWDKKALWIEHKNKACEMLTHNDKIYSVLIKRFGEKRLNEILNQKLEGVIK